MNEFPYDINCDLGEEKNVENAIMPFIQSANIACGAHAGNDETIKDSIRLAKLHAVKIGIHPSYPDRENFGRVVMDIRIEELIKSLKFQIDNFVEIAKSGESQIHHIKFHGALYNEVAKDKLLADHIVNLLQDYPKEWIVFCPPNSMFEAALKENNRTVWAEAFLDRAYNEDGSLVARSRPGAILENKKLVFNQFKKMIQEGLVTSFSGKIIELQARTFCIHGDHDNSIEILKYLKDQFEDGEL